MGLNKKAVDLLATNKLMVAPTLISAGEAWRNQIQGTYHLLYQYIAGDFSHFEDVAIWIRGTYEAHTHTGVHGPTGPPLIKLPLRKIFANAYLFPMAPFGKIRIGFAKLVMIVTGILRNDKRLS